MPDMIECLLAVQQEHTGVSTFVEVTSYEFGGPQ